MKYKIIVDKQSSANPSSEKKEYLIDIEELRVKGNVYDSLVITKDEDYVMRRLSLSEYYVLSVLEEPIKETIPDLGIELFEGDNYIYLIDMTGNKFYAEYIVKNDFTDIYVTKNEMNSLINQTAQSIELSVNQKLISYATNEDVENSVTELNSKITQTAEKIQLEVNKKVDETELGTKIIQDIESVQIAWNQISEYIKYINGEMRIYDSDGNILMTLNKLGQNFNNSGNLIGRIGTNQLLEDTSKKSLDFDLDEEGNFMTWATRTSSDTPYYWKWTYTKGGISTAQDEGLYAGVPIYMNSNELHINDYLYFNGGNVLYVANDNQFIFNMTSGNAWVNSDGSFECTTLYSNNVQSDGRLKENIEKSTINALGIINEIAVRSFDWKKDKKHVKAGFIAQEMEKIDDNFVLKNPIKDDEGTIIDYKYYINELPIIAILTKGIQEQQEEIKELKNMIAEQNKYIEKILKELNIEKNIKDTTSLEDAKIETKNEIMQYEDKIKENTNFRKGKPVQIKMIKDNNFITLVKEVNNG